MRKVLEGKLYNTETARCGAEYHHTNMDDYFQDYTIYLTKSGMYFLHCSGTYGKWHYKAHNNIVEKIIPLTYEQAKTWSKKFLQTNDYNKLFGSDDDNDKIVPMTISVPVRIKTNLNVMKQQTNKNVSKLVIEALEQYYPCLQ